MKPTVVIQTNGRWSQITPEEFERDYHMTLLDSDEIWWMNWDRMTIGHCENKAALWEPTRGLHYITGWNPMVLINGQPKLDLIPAESVVASEEEINGLITKYNDEIRGKTEIGWYKCPDGWPDGYKNMTGWEDNMNFS